MAKSKNKRKNGNKKGSDFMKKVAKSRGEPKPFKPMTFYDLFYM